MLKDITKQALYAVAPQTMAAVMSMRARAHSHRLVRQWGLHDLNQRLLRQLGSSVVAGPFAGMTLTPMTHDEHLGPFLLGTYESELHPWFEQLPRIKFAQIVDVGAKFGYYAVGLARRFPGTPVVTFDTDPWARAALREMADANEVRHITVRGFCSPDWFKTSLRDHSLVISDCEGYERELFPAIQSHTLETTTMLIELHEALAPGATDAVISKVRHTHEVQWVQSRAAPAPPDIPEVTSFSREEMDRLAREIRPPQEWVLLTPKAASSQLGLPESRAGRF
jgi:hypothetical protein